jgi:hypothetical protein
MQAGGSLYADTRLTEKEVRTIGTSEGCGMHKSTRRMTRGALQLFFDSHEGGLVATCWSLVSNLRREQPSIVQDPILGPTIPSDCCTQPQRRKRRQKRSTANRRSDVQFRIRSPHHCYIAACYLQAAKDRASILSINTFKRSCDSMAR